jgi:hypothetical protein
LNNYYKLQLPELTTPIFGQREAAISGPSSGAHELGASHFSVIAIFRVAAGEAG